MIISEKHPLHSELTHNVIVIILGPENSDKKLILTEIKLSSSVFLEDTNCFLSKPMNK